MTFWHSPTKRLLGARAGNLATMTALFAPVMIAVGAVAVDAASLYVERRQAQGLVDLAALTAAANPAKTSEAARRSFADNSVTVAQVAGFSSATKSPSITVVPGRYDPTQAVGARFTAGAAPANAVQVGYARIGTRHFGASLIPPPLITVAATAAQTPRAAFSIGTRLAKLDGGVANALLGAMFGTNLSLSALDYQSLLSANVSLFPYLDALALTVNAKAATYSDLLQSTVSLGDMAAALASMTGVQPTLKSFARTLADDADTHTLKVQLSRLIGLDAGAGSLTPGSGGGSGVSASVRALDMLSAQAAVANGSRQLAVGLSASIPGLLSADLQFATGEPMAHSPWLTYGEAGTVVRTAQTRLLLTVKIAPAGAILGTSVTLPIYIELASAEATLTSVACPTGRVESASVTIAAKPSIAEARIASFPADAMVDFKKKPTFTPATLVKAPLVSVKGDVLAPLASTSAKSVTFDAAAIAAHTIKSVSTTTAVASLTQPLVNGMHLDVSVLGLGIGIPGLATAALSATLTPVAPAVDTLLFSVLSVLGVKLGEVDIRVDGVHCGRPVLVQ